MDKTFFTINDLISFCKSKNCYNFSAKTAEDSIKIRDIGMFSAETDGDDQTMFVKLKSCHVGKNLNKSFISKDSMQAAMPSFKGKPILGAFVQNEDTNEWDFNGHDMELYEDENGKTQVKYIEQVIGNISEVDEPVLEYDKEQDKDYVIVKGKIFKEYTKAEEILNRRKSCACSVELAVQDLSYNTVEDCIELNSFTFMGVTLLGASVKPGMAGSNLVVESFEQTNSSYQEKLINTLERLNVVLESFNNTNAQKKGGKIKMNNNENTTVVEEEVNTSEEITEENTEETTNEETSTSEDTEVVETEACGGQKKKKKKCSEGEESEDEIDEGSDDDEPEITEQEACGKKRKKKCSIDEYGNITVSYEISHEETRSALYSLLCEFEDSDNEWYFITNVYDEYFVYENWDGNKCYRQDYVVENDNISFSGERIELFKMLLTESEKIAIDKLRSDYATLESKYNELAQFKANAEAAELKAKKDAIFARSEYSVIADDEAFKTLVADAEKYSVDEVEAKAKAIFADYVIKTGTFSAKDDGEKKPKVLGFNFNKKETKSGPYGNLFKND